ncbi:transcription factor-like 5 protein [Polyodon spathula]|uniref:transcription factor-like 5 protein n=1 Tax=Polyodon spathula TaxID=7913 RepID=UPI001B7DDDC0|nr:transcription factor-like 5 protein [Polyodon spathula]
MCKTQPQTPPSENFSSDPDQATVAHSESTLTNEQGLTFSTDLNLVEMTEVEYTQLQHIIYSQMEAQVDLEGAAESRLNPGVFTTSSPSNQTVCQPSNPQHLEYPTNAVNPSVYCTSSSQPDLASDARFITANSNHGHVDFQELKMILMSDSTLNNAVLTEKTPTNCGEAPVTNLAKARHAEGMCKEHRVFPIENAKATAESRPNPAARVRLEKRFYPSEVSRHQEPPESSAALRHIKLEVLRQKTVTCSGEYSSDTCFQSILFCKEETSHKHTANKRTRTRGRQANTERRALHDIQNVPASQPTRAATSTRKKSIQEGENSQRRERHNCMERDRRRRIRICCDELNMLVPFCTVETDKATTLQWTTAFLKYIHEIHGDSLKREFEGVFCGKTGKRMKLGRAEQFVTYGDQGNSLRNAAIEQK